MTELPPTARQGWRTPQPAGVCDMCTEEKNAIAGRHTALVTPPNVPRAPNEVLRMPANCQLDPG